MPEIPFQREFDDLKAKLDNSVRTARRVIIALLAMQAVTLLLLIGIGGVIAYGMLT